ASPRTVWAVGEFGTVLKTVDGGATWLAQRVGAESLRGLAAGSPDAAWAVGDGGAIIRTSDGGSTWTSARSGASVALRAATAGSPLGRRFRRIPAQLGRRQHRGARAGPAVPLAVRDRGGVGGAGVDRRPGRPRPYDRRRRHLVVRRSRCHPPGVREHRGGLGE